MRFFIAVITGCLVMGMAFMPVSTVQAAEKSKPAYTQAQIEKVAFNYQIPWTEMAAILTYENNKTPKSRGIEWPSTLWGGPWDPNPEEKDPNHCKLFGGVGVDANSDGIAEPADETDSLVALGNWLGRYEHSAAGFQKALELKYEREDIRKRILGFQSVYETFHRFDLSEYAFPIPRKYDYSYKDTWGDRRGWGGRRIHEGTDIFAGYGTPVLATTYGFIEIKGWNDYGGWRIGLRGIDNVYYYYAHLSSFAKGIQQGTVVKPGQVIGYVGSSGYGKPGTSGKFEPHLHYGMYRGAGPKEWAYDPYPFLRRWEKLKKS